MHVHINLIGSTKFIKDLTGYECESMIVDTNYGKIKVTFYTKEVSYAGVTVIGGDGMSRYDMSVLKRRHEQSSSKGIVMIYDSSRRESAISLMAEILLKVGTFRDDFRINRCYDNIPESSHDQPRRSRMHPQSREGWLPPKSNGDDLDMFHKRSPGLKGLEQGNECEKEMVCIPKQLYLGMLATLSKC
jgi:hypothetical protein